jgi:hypothetical protein
VETVRQEAPLLAARLPDLPDNALVLSGGVAEIVQRIEGALVEGGLRPDSNLANRMFGDFGRFLVVAEAARTSPLGWLCRDYPFDYFCR